MDRGLEKKEYTVQMKTILSALFVLVITSGIFTPQFLYAEQNFDFETVSLGELPADWKIEATDPRGELATWEVISNFENGKNTQVLGVTKVNDGFGGTFNICWTDNVSFEDGEIEVDFKALTGVEDQGGGPMWRVKDKNNYYIARANPLENNFRIYYVKEGARKILDGARVKVPSREWQTIKIIQNGNHVEGYLNGKKYLEWEDSTFPDAGGVGLWTKADAVTLFDNVKVTRSEK